MADLLAFWTALSDRVLWVFIAGLGVVLVFNALRWAQNWTHAKRLRSRGPWVPHFASTPRVSVLVPAWNERATIEAHIESFLRLRYPAKELILCAGGDDGTLGLARAHEGGPVTVLEQAAGEGKQRALQRCFERATGEIVYLTDADCLLTDESFERTVEPIVNGVETVTTGSSDPLNAQLRFPFVRHQWLVGVYWQYHEREHALGLMGRNAALRRDVVLAAGEFRDEVRIGVDNVLGKKALALGHAIRYIPESRVRSVYPEGVREYWRQQTRWQRIRVVHGFKGWNRKDALAAIIPQVLALLLFVGFAAAIWLGWLIAAVWGLAWIHLVLTRLRYLGFGQVLTRTRLRTADLLRLPGYLVLDQLVAAGTLFQYPSKASRARW